jgi:hypothetical protein
MAAVAARASAKECFFIKPPLCGSGRIYKLIYIFFTKKGRKDEKISEKGKNINGKMDIQAP